MFNIRRSAVFALALAAMLVVTGLALSTLPTTILRSTTDKTTKADNALKDAELIRQEMSVPQNYSLNFIMLGARRTLLTETPGTSRVVLTTQVLSSNLKLKEVIEKYDEGYLKWEKFCYENIRDLAECEERGYDQPGPFYAEITPKAYKTLRDLLNAEPAKEVQSLRIENLGRISVNWVSYNGTKYRIELLSDWSKSGSNIDEGARSKKIFDFDKDQAGIVPSFLEIGMTGEGTKSVWSVKQDPTAPSPPNVLAQLSEEVVNFHFPYAIVKGEEYKDVSVSVSFKTISGKLDQAAGIIFRFKDSNNYYVLRANALENNVILFKYIEGKRAGVASAPVTVTSGQWHLLKVVAVGDSIQGYLDDKLVIDTKDSTYKEGMVGLWTKADSVTYFDNLRVG